MTLWKELAWRGLRALRLFGEPDVVHAVRKVTIREVFISRN